MLGDKKLVIITEGSKFTLADLQSIQEWMDKSDKHVFKITVEEDISLDSE